MEAANNERSRKRAREDADNTETLKAKKQECSNNSSYNDDQIRRYAFHDGIGVFDFPWLKEGVTFNFEDDHEQNFAYLHEDDAAETTVCSPQNLSVPPPPTAVDGDHGGGKKEDEEERLWSLAVDDLEQVDCIWSCVIDQPLDVGFNKA